MTQASQVGRWGTPTHESDAPSARLPALIVLLAMLLGASLVIVDRRPNEAVGLDAAPDAFSASRAMQSLATIASEPHHTGQIGHPRVRDFLIAELESLGAEVEVQVATPDGRPTLYNVLGRFRGSDDTGALLFASHYDSVTRSAGATDVGVGVAAILEMARALQVSGPLRNDVIVFFPDAEERGLLGARAFVDQHPWAADVGFVANLDGGGHGQAALAEVHRGSVELVGTYLDVVPEPHASSFMVALAEALQDADFGGSDFSVLRELDVPGVFLAHAVDVGFRHTPADGLWRVDPDTVQHYGDTILALARELGTHDLSIPTPTQTTVFPGLLSGLPLVWGGTTAIVVAMLVVGLHAWLLTTTLRRGGKLRGIARGLTTALKSIVVVPLSVWILVRLVELRPGWGPYFRGRFLDDNVVGLAPPDAAPLYWGLGVAGATVSALLFARARRKASAQDLLAGALIPLVLLTVLTSLSMAGISYVFALTSLAAPPIVL